MGIPVRNLDKAEVDARRSGMSYKDLFMWGVYDVAYIKSVDLGETQGYAIFAADGGRIAYANTWDEALVCVRQMDLEPVSAH